MKKLFVLLAAVGIFASCSKEAPVLPATDKVQGATSPHSGNKADRITIGMDMSGVLEEFEQVIGSLDAPQEARGISTPINPAATGAKGTKLIDYKPEFLEEGPGSKEKVLHALGIIYDKTTGATVDVIMDFKPHGNNGMIFKGKVSPIAGSSTALAWKALEESKMKDAYISIYIGVDGASNQLEHRFTNKGAYLVQKRTQKAMVKLPENFVVLKSLDNKLDWAEGSEYPVFIKDRKIAKFSLQGYLLAVRFRNAFPEKVVKHTSTSPSSRPTPDPKGKLAYRPNLPLKLRVQGLSVANVMDINYSSEKKAVTFAPNSTPTVGFKRNTNGYYEVQIQNPQDNEYAGGSREIISVPVDHSRQKGSLSANEEFILFYCPDPLDKGGIAFEPDNNLFYDGTMLSMDDRRKHYSLAGVKNVIAKVKGQGSRGTQEKRDMPTDGKIFFQMFDIAPDPTKVSSAPAPLRPTSYRAYYTALGFLRDAK